VLVLVLVILLDSWEIGQNDYDYDHEQEHE
jgi:hypothetical protein